jgi:hypothetical protein
MKRRTNSADNPCLCIPMLAARGRFLDQFPTDELVKPLGLWNSPEVIQGDLPPRRPAHRIQFTSDQNGPSDASLATTNGIADPEECAEAQATGFNCSQFVEFQPDGSAIFMITDIINPATYRIDGGAVILEPTAPSEIGTEEIRFTGAEDWTALTGDAGTPLQGTWTLVAE